MALSLTAKSWSNQSVRKKRRRFKLLTTWNHDQAEAGLAGTMLDLASPALQQLTDQSTFPCNTSMRPHPNEAFSTSKIDPDAVSQRSSLTLAEPGRAQNCFACINTAWRSFHIRFSSLRLTRTLQSRRPHRSRSSAIHVLHCCPAQRVSHRECFHIAAIGTFKL